jgi:lipoyl(octanoyl) transferase
MEWKKSADFISYPEAIEAMEKRVAAMIEGKADELIWFIEHPPLYTAGTSAKDSELLKTSFPAYHTGRGGQWTYHGPGQRIVYVMLDLKKRDAMDVRCFVRGLEKWIIATLAHFGIESFIRDGRVGVWVNTKSGEAKIAALGIRLRKWVTFHGIAINVAPDLSHYAGIVPCGIKEYGVTSMKALGVDVSLEEIDTVLKKEFEKAFANLSCLNK